MTNSVAMNDMIEPFRKELVLCGVKDSTTVAVLSEIDRLADLGRRLYDRGPRSGRPSLQCEPSAEPTQHVR